MSLITSLKESFDFFVATEEEHRESCVMGECVTNQSVIEIIWGSTGRYTLSSQHHKKQRYEYKY